jgi:intracellular septation protein A
MTSQRAIELFAILNFFVVGMSLVVRPVAWARFFTWMQREGEAGAVIYGLLCVLWGSLIVSFHPTWRGAAAVLPAFGSLQLLEGLAFLIMPRLGLRIMAVFSEDRLWLFRLLGLIALVLVVYIHGEFPSGLE